MGITHIRSGRDFLQRAGSTGFEDLAVIPNCGKSVLLLAQTIAQEDVEQYKDLICSLSTLCSSNIWLQQDPARRGTGRLVPSEPSPGLDIPKCVVTPCLQTIYAGPANRGNNNNNNPSTTPTSEHCALAYLVVIQGRVGSLRSKLLVLTSVQDVGSEMFHHVMNGWSVVFTGAVLQGDLKELGRLSVPELYGIRLEKVARKDDLGFSDGRLPIWC